MTDTRLPGQLVDIPLPPDADLAFGYRGNARYIGFCWWPGADTIAYQDGASSGTGNGWAFLGFKRHRAVAPLLEPFDLGSSEEDGTHMLLIDREAQRASVAPAAEAREFLAAQHPPAPELSPEEQEAFEREFRRLLDEMRNRPIDHEAIAREMAEQRGRIGRMISWLDQCPLPPNWGQTP